MWSQCTWPLIARDEYCKKHEEQPSETFWDTHNPLVVLRDVGMWRSDFPPNIQYKQQKCDCRVMTRFLVSVHRHIQVPCMKDGELDLLFCDHKWTRFCPLVYRCVVDSKPDNVALTLSVGCDLTVPIKNEGWLKANLCRILCHLMSPNLVEAFDHFHLRPHIPQDRCERFQLKSEWFKAGESYSIRLKAYNVLRLQSCDLAFVC